MTFEALIDLIGTVPFMPPERGKLIYEFILSAQPQRVLELGFAHGTSSCYMAAAMQENGSGMVHTIDNRSALQRSPSIHDLLERSGLGDFVSPVFTELGPMTSVTVKSGAMMVVEVPTSVLFVSSDSGTRLW